MIGKKTAVNAQLLFFDGSFLIYYNDYELI